jgi:hypothetical protein
MRKDWKYILYISAAFGLFVMVKLLSPRQHNWAITYSYTDKDPYGGYALNRLLGSVFPKENIHHSFKTLYELSDSIAPNSNILILSSGFEGGKEDSDFLLKHVAHGGKALISSQYFLGHFADTLGIGTYDYFFKTGEFDIRKDTATLRFVSSATDTVREYFYRRDNIHNYFNRFDSTRTSVIAKNDRGMPVTIRVHWGKGDFILNSTPLVFTNIYLLSSDNHRFVSTTLSYLSNAPVKWTEYYHVGRMEVGTPLRFILTNTPLRWAYYITLIALLLYMAFEMKRKQRIIPVIKPLANTTIEFIQTIGNLYFQSAGHKSIAEKRIHFLLDHIRSQHWMSFTKLDESFVQTLARKTGKPEEDIRKLVMSMNSIQSKTKISADELIEFNQKIEKFNK